MFQVFAKLGMAYWNDEAKATAGLGSASEDDDGTDLTFGGGVEFSFVQEFGLRGEWERIDFDGEDVDLLSISGVFNF